MGEGEGVFASTHRNTCLSEWPECHHCAGLGFRTAGRHCIVHDTVVVRLRRHPNPGRAITAVCVHPAVAAVVTVLDTGRGLGVRPVPAFRHDAVDAVPAGLHGRLRQQRVRLCTGMPLWTALACRTMLLSVVAASLLLPGPRLVPHLPTELFSPVGLAAHALSLCCSHCRTGAAVVDTSSSISPTRPVDTSTHKTRSCGRVPTIGRGRTLGGRRL